MAPYGLLIRFCALTGLRAAEAQGLRIRDVVLSATGAHVEVRQTIKRIGGVWTVGTRKPTRSTRDVPLLDRALIADLKLYLLAHRALATLTRCSGLHAATALAVCTSRGTSTAAQS